MQLDRHFPFNALNTISAQLQAERRLGRAMIRSAVVNIEKIVRLEAISHGEFDAVLQDGSLTRVSRTYRTFLERRL